jgi:hypothetical protein
VGSFKLYLVPATWKNGRQGSERMSAGTPSKGGHYRHPGDRLGRDYVEALRMDFGESHEEKEEPLIGGIAEPMSCGNGFFVAVHVPVRLGARDGIGQRNYSMRDRNCALAGIHAAAVARSIVLRDGSGADVTGDIRDPKGVRHDGAEAGANHVPELGGCLRQ